MSAGWRLFLEKMFYYAAGGLVLGGWAIYYLLH